MSTYRLAPDERSITCLVCGRTSYNANDVDKRYCGACHFFHDDVMVQWCIYKHPSDYPDHFVARKFVIARPGKVIPTNDIRLADTLEVIRKIIPPGLTAIPRADADDPVIVETWL